MRVLVLGITGQDGSYLAEILLAKRHEVHGVIRRSSVDNLQRIKHIKEQITLHKGDLSDPLSIHKIISDVRPDIIYNEADQDDVRWSKYTPAQSYDITGAAVGRILESILQIDKRIKFFQPVSATIFGTHSFPFTENNHLSPQSPYACAKAMAFHLVKYYRETYGLFASTAIMCNHDSPRRSEEYLVSKICRSMVRIATGKQKELSLGNLETEVDVGYAPEFMEAITKIMELSTPTDIILGTGGTCTIGELVDWAKEIAGANYSEFVLTENPNFSKKGKRLTGSINKAKSTIDFNPQYYGRSLIEKMIHDIKLQGAK